MLARLGWIGVELRREMSRRLARRRGVTGSADTGPGGVERGFDPSELRALDRRLAEVAAEERSRLTGISEGTVAELRTHRRDVLGGSVDLERGSARIRFADRDVVLVSEDMQELRTVVEAAPLLPTALHTARADRRGHCVLVFSVQDWTVVIAADPVLPVDR